VCVCVCVLRRGRGVVATVVIGKEIVGFVANLLRHLLACCSLANTARILAQPFFFRQFSESELVAWAKWLIVRLLEQPNWRFCDDTLLGPFLKQNLKSLSLSVQFDIITPQPSHCNVLLYISVQLYIKVNTKSCPHASYCIVFL